MPHAQPGWVSVCVCAPQLSPPSRPSALPPLSLQDRPIRQHPIRNFHPFHRCYHASWYCTDRLEGARRTARWTAVTAYSRATSVHAGMVDCSTIARNKSVNCCCKGKPRPCYRDVDNCTQHTLPLPVLPASPRHKTHMVSGHWRRMRHQSLALSLGLARLCHKFDSTE